MSIITKSLSKDQLDRVAIDGIQKFSDLFTEFAYSKQTVVKGEGSWTRRPEGFFFLSASGTMIETWGSPDMKWSLGAKPTAQVLSEGNRRCTAVQAFHVIPWPDYGVALVTATPVDYIGQPWIAFVSIDSLPVINSTNTSAQ